ILIDTGPDLRAQALAYDIARIDAVLYTHLHADHIFGIDDLRPFNFINRMSIPLYADDQACTELYDKFRYCFEPDPDYEGGAAPHLTRSRIEPYVPLELFGIEILPLTVLHGRMPVVGYRIGTFAYLTDCSAIPERSREQLSGLDILVLDA